VTKTDNRVALVTGGSRGIGRGIAIELARVGFDLVINYAANESAAAEARAAAIEASPGGKARVETCRGDLVEHWGRERVLEFAREHFDRLDLLVNNAGIAPVERVDLLEASEESFDRVLGVNLKAPYLLTQPVARWMIDLRVRLGADYRPAIVNITSVSAYAASADRGDYCVSKAGLAMLTKLFAARLASEGISVYEVCPGIIATEMTQVVKEKYDALIAGGLTPIQRWGTPEDVGRAVAALTTGAFSFSTGEVINVDGGFHLRRL
jgi:NAD(P)-dependent dehydrogenase (short-subunit alcohol dehydrogenase family)